jgi:hypothetical protein
LEHFVERQSHTLARRRAGGGVRAVSDVIRGWSGPRLHVPGISPDRVGDDKFYAFSLGGA